MRKEHFKDGKKYMLLGPSSRYFGTPMYWGDKIKDFRVCDLDGIKHNDTALFVCNEGKIIRINRNGTKYYR